MGTRYGPLLCPSSLWCKHLGCIFGKVMVDETFLQHLFDISETLKKRTFVLHCNHAGCCRCPGRMAVMCSMQGLGRGSEGEGYAFCNALARRVMADRIRAGVAQRNFSFMRLKNAVQGENMPARYGVLLPLAAGSCKHLRRGRPCRSHVRARPGRRGGLKSLVRAGALG